MTDKHSGKAETIGGGFKAINYVMSIARQVGARKLSASVRSKNACKACAFGTGGQRGGLHNEHSSRVEICNKNIQAQLSEKFEKKNFGLYRDDGLAVFRNISGPQAEKIKKEFQRIFKQNHLDITILCNLKIVNYLDVTLNLNDGT